MKMSKMEVEIHDAVKMLILRLERERVFSAPMLPSSDCMCFLFISCLLTRELQRNCAEIEVI